MKYNTTLPLLYFVILSIPHSHLTAQTTATAGVITGSYGIAHPNISIVGSQSEGSAESKPHIDNCGVYDIETGAVTLLPDRLPTNESVTSLLNRLPDNDFKYEIPLRWKETTGNATFDTQSRYTIANSRTIDTPVSFVPGTTLAVTSGALLTLDVTDHLFSLPNLELEIKDNAQGEINATNSATTLIGVESLSICREVKGGRWSPLALPFTANNEVRLNNRLQSYTKGISLADNQYTMVYYDSESRAVNGSGGNWKHPLSIDENQHLGRLFLTSNNGNLIVTAAAGALTALTNSSALFNLTFNPAPEIHANDNGWNFISTGKCYSDYAEQTDLSIAQEYCADYEGERYKTVIIDGANREQLRPFTPYFVQATDENQTITRSFISEPPSSFVIELVEQSGEVVDKVLVTIGSSSSQYNVMKLGQRFDLSIESDGNPYCAIGRTQFSETTTQFSLRVNAKDCMIRKKANKGTMDVQLNGILLGESELLSVEKGKHILTVKSLPMGTPSAPIDHATIHGVDRGIRFKNFKPGITYSIYTSNGKLVLSGAVASIDQFVSIGVGSYIVKVDNRTKQVVIRN